MADYSSFNTNSQPGCAFSGSSEPFWSDFGSPSRGFWSGSVSQPLVFDSEKGELVRAPATPGKKAVPEEKAIAALKSHSEAERRRRERINSHLDTLRQLLPCKEKMDKATLLAEVIKRVKELKRTAMETSQGFLVPMGDDEVKVEPFHGETDGKFSFKASVCCEYIPELMGDLREALDALQLDIVKAEISSLEGRWKNEFVFTSPRTGHNNEVEAGQTVTSSVHRALMSVLEKASTSPEYLPRGNSLSKRRRIPYFESSGRDLDQECMYI